ncbi:DUF3379 domain-containing protein [Alginatibacterium sediminis]|uniref:DUF3379 domain-containing protein n=1 Tax=Alginatibacterium sediminis TaxID=2164068 RepID=A0A420EG56_9ALTE|nr:DUF3379 family protein [Alginatibacterium sediminis]RKF19667.1 DUF3379 domain-containing protein [Alginatibacterium sediminis]
MDELEFRRQLLANPRERESEFMAAANENSSNRKLFDEMQSFESKLESALKVDVPEGMAERLILRQSFDTGRSQYKRKARLHLALAASVAFALGLSFNSGLLSKFQQPDIGSVALAHVYEEMPYTSQANEHPNLAMVNAKLARYGASFDSMPGQVKYVNHCSYHGGPALHMVIDGKMGDINVFVVPDGRGLKPSQSFGDKRMHGLVQTLQNASMVIVGDRMETLEPTLQSLSKNFVQSI